MEASWDGPIEDLKLSNRARNAMRRVRCATPGSPHSEIMRRMAAWLPREQIEDAKRPQGALMIGASPPGPTVRQLEDVHIRDLREAIRANRVSFPSQVPTFTRHDQPDLQRKLAQLYFVLGWDYGNIGARYGLGPARVRQILDTWKCRAVKAGYIQHITPAEVISRQPMVRASRRTMTAAPNIIPPVARTPFSSPAPDLLISSEAAIASG